MLSKYIPKRYAQALLKHVVAVSLFIPYIYSKTNNCYYQDFILANAFAILTMITILTSWKLDLKKNGIFLAGLSILLIAYNVIATYMNYNYLHWYGEQINTTICFLFFMLLLMVKDSHALFDRTFIRSIIHMMVSCNVLAIGYRLITGQSRILFLNNYIRLDKYDFLYVEQYSWVYIHKSQFAIILILCISFCTIYRNYFNNSINYIISIGVLLFSLYLSESYTSMAAVTLIFFGFFMDYLIKVKWQNKILLSVLLGVPGTLTCLKLYSIINSKRNLLTLGNRTIIWKASYETISNNPNGMINFIMGADMFENVIDDAGTIMQNYNCHNVFLNHMFRFSFPVGSIFLALIILIFLFSLKRKFSFTTLGIWLAIFIPLCMDYSMTCAETTFFLLIIYCMFFTDLNTLPKNTN